MIQRLQEMAHQPLRQRCVEQFDGGGVGLTHRQVQGGLDHLLQDPAALLLAVAVVPVLGQDFQQGAAGRFNRADVVVEAQPVFAVALHQRCPAAVERGAQLAQPLEGAGRNLGTVRRSRDGLDGE
ncbi:hypothetical protein D3C79_926280 [compost metagenome]